MGKLKNFQNHKKIVLSLFSTVCNLSLADVTEFSNNYETIYVYLLLKSLKY